MAIMIWFRACWLSVAVLCSAMPAAAVDLPKAVRQAMAGKRGTAAVVDVDSGRVLASFNLSAAARRVVRPGSAVKPFTLLALLASGKLEPATTLACRRKLTIAGHKLDCGHPEAGHPLDAASALAYSCNDYFTSMATLLTPAELQQALLKAGLGSASGLVAHEARGEVLLSTTREQLQLQSIGEANVRTTPLALLAAYRKLALQRRNPPDPALHTVFAGLEGSADFGMARLAKSNEQMKIAGKTGTSLADEGIWTHGWFVGFAPAEAPEVAIVVFLERGTGPADAAPIARKILSAYVRTNN